MSWLMMTVSIPQIRARYSAALAASEGVPWSLPVLRHRSVRVMLTTLTLCRKATLPSRYKMASLEEKR